MTESFPIIFSDFAVFYCSARSRVQFVCWLWTFGKKITIKERYTAITKIPSTKPQILQGGKFSTRQGIWGISPLCLQKCSNTILILVFFDSSVEFLLDFLTALLFSLTWISDKQSFSLVDVLNFNNN